MFEILKSILRGARERPKISGSSDELPDDYETCNGIGLGRLAHHEWEDAARAFLKAIEIDPGRPEGYCNFGITLERRGEIVGAIEQYRKALALYPEAYAVLDLLANACRMMGDQGECLKLRRRLVDIYPEDPSALSGYLYELSYSPAVAPGDYIRAARRYGALLAAAAQPFDRWPSATISPKRRLRIGFVSGDFNSHPVGYFLENALSHYEGDRLELVAYPTTEETDALTERLRPCFVEWHSLFGLDDASAARRIHGDGIDILIDLSGHTLHNRLPVFAWKPAPVQVSWLGYFASTGVGAIDYLLADTNSVMEPMQEEFTESLWFLPETRLCFTPPNIEMEVSPLPVLQAGHVTFGCFQSLAKINDEVLAAWGRILRRLPDARLRLQSMYLSFPAMDGALRKRMAKAGIDVDRVSLHGSTDRRRYLQAYSEVDVILDTFPYPGGTTTCEALWMGVPSVTLAGQTLLSRQGAALLTSAEMGDWVASNEKGYEDLAVGRASDIGGLTELRLRLRDRAAASPLFDGARFARNLEEAMIGIWNDKYRATPMG